MLRKCLAEIRIQSPASLATPSGFPYNSCLPLILRNQDSTPVELSRLLGLGDRHFNPEFSILIHFRRVDRVIWTRETLS